MGENVYTHLFFKDEYIDLVSTHKVNTNENIFLKKDEELRIKLNEKLAQDYFQTEGLYEIIVFDDKQEVSDTLALNNFEYYENMVESSYIATYVGEQSISDKVFINFNKQGKTKYSKSPQVISIPSAKKRLIDILDLNSDFVLWDGCLVAKKDTFSIISYFEYSYRKPSVYLSKNGIITDSLKEDYVFDEIKPVPIANEHEVFYMAYVSIPDTDNYWTMFIGIDLNSGKLKTYKNNKYVEVLK